MSRSDGGPEASPITTRIVELLEGRGWVEREPVIREAGKVIPPGVAVRQAERGRRKAAVARNHPTPNERIKPARDERLIEIGRRQLVVTALRTMKVHGYLEQRTDDDGSAEWVRMTGLPARVARDRRRGKFDPVNVANAIRDGADADTLLRELTPNQVMRVALELAHRERRRAMLTASSTANGEETRQWPNE